jgi:GMC oxidoreductase
VLVLSGAGVGGGSLVYANVLYEPLEPFFRDPQWAEITDWRAELGPHYETARQMLGATEVPFESAAEHVVRRIALRMPAGGCASGGPSPARVPTQRVAAAPVGADGHPPRAAGCRQHILGGCCIGASPQTGVIDAYHRVFAEPGLHVVDGSAIGRDPGREPVADDRRAGRARARAMAPQGRPRLPSAAR